ncbi:MAG: hypothetical protein ACLROI_04170 [Beduini sp.]|uniref:hypothetical protein n=1 Tax=Beduini sp. TaxID=1922300 RepID=UPI0011CAEA0F
MKKSTILGVLTAAALITTSAATYAAWDQTTANADQTIAIRERITLEASATKFIGGDLETTKDEITYTGTYTFKAATVDGTVNTLQLTPTVKGNDGTTALEASKYAIEIKKGDTVLTTDGNVYTDSAVENGNNVYTVNLKIKDPNLANTNVTVSINGELVKTTPAS